MVTFGCAMGKAGRKNRSLLRKIIEYSIVVAIILLIGYVYYNIADQVLELYRLNDKKDYTQIKTYLKSFGVKGAFMIAFLEMAQMVVVFIPAEFVQISAGLAYPVYIALPLCMLGVFMGSSVIFLIVRCLHLRLDYIESKTGKIEALISKINKDVSMTVIMYILFIMPLIPFGAIAYFASSSKIKYPRYALVCTTGVIPSILTSYCVGNVMYNFLGRGTAQFIIAITVVIILMFLLLFFLVSLIKRKFFKKAYDRSNFLFYHIVYFFVNLYLSIKLKIRKKDCVRPKNKPYIVLGRHTSFFDFYFTGKALYPERPAYVCNRFFFEDKKTSFFVKRLGAIPKRLFTVDIDTMRYMRSAIDQKCPVIIYSEGRLSNDGHGMGAAKNTEKLIKKYGVDVYGFYTVGGYFSRPKWRNFFVRHQIDLYLKPLFTAEELKTATDEEISRKLDEFYTYDETDNYALVDKKYEQANICGLENILYRCKSCGSEYTLSSHDNRLHCSACGEDFVFDDGYKLNDGTKISDWCEAEKQALKSDSGKTYRENCYVAKLCKGKMEKCGSGVVTMDDEGITYVGTDGENSVTYKKTVKEMPSLAFSCNEEFEFYVGTELIYFYPENPQTVVKWSLRWDLLQRNIENE